MPLPTYQSERLRSCEVAACSRWLETIKVRPARPYQTNTAVESRFGG